MKYLCVLFVAIVTIACNFQVSDTRSPATAAATRTAKAVLPLPPVPGGVIRVRIFPTVDLPTVTPQSTKASNP